MGTIGRKEYDQRPIQLLVYLPDRFLSPNDRMFFASIYKAICDKSELYSVDNLSGLVFSLEEKRTDIYALIREESHIQCWSKLSKLVYTTNDICEQFNLGILTSIIRYEDDKKWIGNENYLKLYKHENGMVAVNKSIDNIFHHIKHPLLVYNLYINSVETFKYE